MPNDHPPPPDAQEEFQCGQLVSWRPAPLGIAQVEEVLRTRVRLFYRCRTGRVRMPVVSAAELRTPTAQPPLPIPNAFGRARPWLKQGGRKRVESRK